MNVIFNYKEDWPAAAPAGEIAGGAGPGGRGGGVGWLLTLPPLLLGVPGRGEGFVRPFEMFPSEVDIGGVEGDGVEEVGVGDGVVVVL